MVLLAFNHKTRNYVPKTIIYSRVAFYTQTNKNIVTKTVNSFFLSSNKKIMFQRQLFTRESSFLFFCAGAREAPEERQLNVGDQQFDSSCTTSSRAGKVGGVCGGDRQYDA